MGETRRTTFLTSAFVAATIFLGSCASVHVNYLADDALGGRVPGTEGHDLAQNYIVGYMKAHGGEALDGTTLASAYRDDYGTGTNLVARIPGTDLADEIVLIGAHYDHLADCDDQGGSPVCNGATDNAAGVGVALEIAAALHDAPEAPRRTVMFAFWDEEEAGLRGSREWIEANPSIVDDVVVYVNYDIQGANLLPSLRNDTLAIGAETGGSALSAAVAAAGSASPLGLAPLSVVFGQGRSDHANFVNASVPTVFLTDATGPCYHTTLDTTEDAVDHGKLQAQRDLGVDLVRALADGSVSPAFDPAAALATYDDAVVIHALLEAGLVDLSLFTPAQQDTLVAREAALQQMVDDGPALFDSTAQSTLLVSALNLVDILASGQCDGFVD